MRARKSAFIALTVMTVIGGAIGLFAPAEPHYQNKALQDHFDRLQGYNGEPTIQKLRDIGPDAVAFLAHQMKCKDSFIRDWYAALWPKLPASIRSRTKQPVSAAAIRVKAVSALRQMGPSFTGSDIGFTSLVAALNHPDIELRSRAEGAIGDLGPKAKMAVPSLIKSVEQRTRTSGGHIGINGIWALGRIGTDAKAALPILESMMKQEGRERVFAAWAVWRIGGENADARMVVMKALEDPDRQTRNDAKNALVESPEIGSR